MAINNIWGANPVNSNTTSASDVNSKLTALAKEIKAILESPSGLVLDNSLIQASLFTIKIADMLNAINNTDGVAKVKNSCFELTPDHARFTGTNGYTEFVPDSTGLKWHRNGGVRYIRNYIGGNTVNTGNHWVEIQALDAGSVNRALGKVPTMSSTVASGTLAMVTDGNITSANYVSSVGVGSTDPVYVQIDLGAEYDIRTIKIWHYYTDGRSYSRNITEVSKDGVLWDTLFSSDYEGDIVETSTGQIITVDLSEDYSYLKVIGFVNIYSAPVTIQLPDSFKGQKIKILCVPNMTAPGVASGNPVAVTYAAIHVVAVDIVNGTFTLFGGMIGYDLIANAAVGNNGISNFQVSFIAIC